MRFRSASRASDVSLAPLLCAGLIGWRSLKIAGDGKRLGLYGFGAAGHIVAQVAKWQGAMSSPSPGRAIRGTQIFARSLGATWAGGSDEIPPEPLDAAIIFATVGELVPLALEGGAQGRPRSLRGDPHERHSAASRIGILWEERQLLSVANLTRQDGIDFLGLVPKIGIVVKTAVYPLEQANKALEDLRAGRFDGAAVLVP